MRRILSRCGLMLVVLAGLAGGVAGRLMWQPRVVAVPAGATQNPDDLELSSRERFSKSAGAPPRGVDSDAWRLLQERPKAGEWGTTLERLHADGRDDLSELVMLSWCEVDGNASLSWLADRPQSEWLGGGAVWQWIANHPAVSWTVALAKDNLALARAAVGSPAAVAGDPAALREILDSSMGRFRSISVQLAERFFALDLQSDFLKLVAADPDAARRILVLTDPRIEGGYSMLATLLEADPRAAEKLLAGGSAKKRGMWQEKLVAHFARSDPNTADRLLAEMPAGSTRDSAATRLAMMRFGSDPTAALALAEQLGGGLAVALTQTRTLSTLKKADPMAALAEAERIVAGAKDATGRRTVDTGLIAALAIVDWKRSFALAVKTNQAYAAQMLTSKQPGDAAGGLAVLREFGAVDADAAARAVTILNTGNTDAIKSLAEEAADNPLTAAARLWLASQPVATEASAQSWRPELRPPDAVMARTLSGLDPSLVQPRMFSDTASWWVQQDPEGASQWVAGLPEGPARDAAIGGMVSALVGERQGFSGWFNSSPASHTSSQSSAEQIDYSSALAWAATARDSTVREDLALKTARRWLDVDPASAVEGLQTIGLPADEKQRLLSELEITP